MAIGRFLEAGRFSLIDVQITLEVICSLHLIEQEEVGGRKEA